MLSVKPDMMDVILEFENADVGYGGVRVLKKLSFAVKRGEICGVIGPNGSGKTTILNAVTGLIRPTHGRILFRGRDVSALPPNVRCNLGIGRTFQTPRLFGSMSVYENVLVAAVHGAGKSEADGRQAALEALQLSSLYERREAHAGELTLLDRKRLEIARAVGTGAKFLLLDEVAAGLTETEVEEITRLLRGLGESGYSILWIEHILDAMLNATDRLLCIAEGRCLLDGPPTEVLHSREVEELYLGVGRNERTDHLKS